MQKLSQKQLQKQQRQERLRTNRRYVAGSLLFARLF